KQKSPIVRSTTAKPIPGLEETTLTEGMAGIIGGGSITPSQFGIYPTPFAGDGDE
ncbi:cyanobactin class RiPP, partial [Moorena sp. SIO4G3]|uniref:cyanobactin class RiPP n=1 Tax=Moorena sp. SIO4G3 TaxID=2607821 RepID=UPI00341C28C2